MTGPVTELDIAREIRDGALDSPQKFANVWLFAIRITGTGASYRKGKKEFVWRDPSLYLNDEFLARCNGLPVILNHPPDNVLDAEEYHKRNVGSVFLPYVRGDEVWAIAKIFDDATAELLQTKQVSTSPAVVFGDPTANETEKLASGATLLIEGEPSLLDHVALCWLGVWDKGGPPTGVESMPETEEEKAAADSRRRADEEAIKKLDSIADAVGSVAKRLDALEEKERERADAVRRDGKPAPMASHDSAGEDEDLYQQEGETDAAYCDRMRARKDRVRRDGVRRDRARLDATDVERRLDALEGREVKGTAMPALLEEQAKADAVAQAFGDAAPRPMSGESLLAYQVRLAGRFQKHSKTYKDVKLASIASADAEGFLKLRDQIYADALAVAYQPVEGQTELREYHQVDQSGRRITKFIGTPDMCWAPWKAPVRFLAGIHKDA